MASFVYSYVFFPFQFQLFISVSNLYGFFCLHLCFISILVLVLSLFQFRTSLFFLVFISIFKFIVFYMFKVFILLFISLFLLSEFTLVF